MADGSKTGRSRGKSKIGRTVQSDHAARLHNVAEEGGVMNHRQNFRARSATASTLSSLHPQCRLSTLSSRQARRLMHQKQPIS
jgi:hypothetical protein